MYNKYIWLKKMKFYIHCEDPEFTMVVKWEDSRGGCVEEVSKLFVDNLQRKIPKVCKQTASINTIMKIGGRTLDKKDQISKKIKHMDDVYVTLQYQELTEEKEDKENDKSHQKQSKDQEVKEKLAPKSEGTQKKSASKIEKMMNLAESYVKQNHLLQAILTYQQVLKEDSANAQACHNLVEIYMAAGRPGKALEWVRRLRNITKEKVWAVRESECYLGMREADKALDMLLNYCKEIRRLGGVETSHKHGVEVLLARAYLQKQQKDMAITVLQGILRENNKHVAALLEYTPLLFPLVDNPSQKEDAMTVLLTLLANNKDDSSVKEKFASVCREEHGMEVLKSVSGPAWEDTASVVFMATSLRDCGAIKEALMLFDHAMQLDPQNAQTLLTYVHALELVEQHSKGIKKIKAYINNFPDMRVGAFTCSMLIPVLENLTGDIYLYNNSINVEVPEVASVPADYSEGERYLLALLFTLVKICYVKGALQVIPSIIKLLDPCCKGRELHQTNIRNEYAYYLCISEVYKIVPVPPVLSKDQRFIYFIGDSHCITPAWQTINFKGEETSIHPILSTGTKIWHLREESIFYPKVNFYSAIGVVPDGASVIFCFGEIDCREALIHCVERARYDSIEEANTCVIEIYIELLLKLQSKRKWNVYVHPVMPVLEPTRSLVMQFNCQLKERVNKCPGLHWLGFVEDLVHTEEDELKLHQNYLFDGTHCHPAYTSHLQTALDRCHDNDA